MWGQREVVYRDKGALSFLIFFLKLFFTLN